MDPIHPIVPQSPTLPAVVPPAAGERVNRDGGRSGETPQRRHRAPRPAGAGPVRTALASGGDDGPADGHPHVDISV